MITYYLDSVNSLRSSFPLYDDSSWPICSFQEDVKKSAWGAFTKGRLKLEGYTQDTGSFIDEVSFGYITSTALTEGATGSDPTLTDIHVIFPERPSSAIGEPFSLERELNADTLAFFNQYVEETLPPLELVFARAFYNSIVSSGTGTPTTYITSLLLELDSVPPTPVYLA